MTQKGFYIWRATPPVVTFFHQQRVALAEVAKLAGIPAPVLAAASDKLRELEAGRAQEGQAVNPPTVTTPSPQVDLFASGAPHPVMEELEGLDIDDMSPREALEKLYELKRKL